MSPHVGIIVVWLDADIRTADQVGREDPREEASQYVEASHSYVVKDAITVDLLPLLMSLSQLFHPMMFLAEASSTDR